ncbi:MAG: HlyD family efflux transporter periplasmic adaptor subunit [Pseudomonadota bacterium]
MWAVFLVWLGLVGARSANADTNARGLVRATIETVISTELVAQVDALPVKAGEHFKRGDVLVTFDCARYAAEHRAAGAEAETARLKVLSEEKLLRHKAIGALEVRMSRATHEQMKARAEALAVRQRQCTITAPFDGHVVERLIQPFEMSKPNSPLISIVNTELELHLIVPSRWMTWLDIGAALKFKVDETDATFDSRVVRINAAVDPISRTVKVVAALTRTDITPTTERQLASARSRRVSPGMSGTATFVRHRDALPFEPVLSHLDASSE